MFINLSKQRAQREMSSELSNLFGSIAGAAITSYDAYETLSLSACLISVRFFFWLSTAIEVIIQ